MAEKIYNLDTVHLQDDSTTALLVLTLDRCFCVQNGDDLLSLSADGSSSQQEVGRVRFSLAAAQSACLIVVCCCLVYATHWRTQLQHTAGYGHVQSSAAAAGAGVAHAVQRPACPSAGMAGA